MTVHVLHVAAGWNARIVHSKENYRYPELLGDYGLGTRLQIPCISPILASLCILFER